MPGIPMLFQGQEFAASTPVPLFRRPSRRSGRGGAPGPRRVPGAVSEHRRPGDAAPPRRPGRRANVPPLSCSISASASATRRLMRCIATCWRCAATIRCSGRRPARVDGAVIGEHAWMLRFFAEDAAGNADRLLLVNLGRDLTLAPMPEPLLAPPEDRAWQILWSSEQPVLWRQRHAAAVSRRRPAHRRRERARIDARPADAGSGAGIARRQTGRQSCRGAR